MGFLDGKLLGLGRSNFCNTFNRKDYCGKEDEVIIITGVNC